MISVKKFQTKDGKIFDCAAEAKQHEAILDSTAKLTDILKVSLATGRPESIVRQILMEYGAVGAVLKCHAKRLPR